jgi:hypothetical protein
MIDDGEMKARYCTNHCYRVEKTGMFAAIWNIKIFDTLFDVPPYKNKKHGMDLASRVVAICW